MAPDSLDDALVRVRSLLVDLQRHIDRGAAEHDLAEIGRAWVRAAQVEQVLRSALPAEVIADVGEIPEPAHAADGHARAAHEDRRARGG